MYVSNSSKPLVFMVVISVFAVALIYSSFTPFIVFAAPPASGWDSSKSCDGLKGQGPGVEVTCCWRERVPGQILGVEYCQTCERTDAGKWECTQKELQVSLEQQPTPPWSLPPTVGENILQQDLGVLEQIPSQGVPPLKQGQGFLPEESIVKQEQPADQGAIEPLVDEPQCPEGQILDEETDLCVLEEPEVTDEPEQSGPEEEQQPSEEGDGSEENSNDDNN